jgi:acyl-CoA reductase-like NAD-dependent aldehyde dehydrogenase
LVTHPDVPLVSFTGSTAVGQHIQAVSAPYIKKLSLEVQLLILRGGGGDPCWRSRFIGFPAMLTWSSAPK